MSWDPVWEKILSENSWGKYPGEDLIRFVARNYYKYSNREDIKILEVGCGPGANLWFLAREGFSIYGIDGSETAINNARERLDQEVSEWKGQLLVGDFNKLPFSDGFFDAVIDIEAVCCNSFDNALSIYHEIARVTKSGGKLFSRTFAKGSWGDETGEKIGHNSYIVGEGPLLNLGLARFTDFGEIPLLLQDYQNIEVELLTRTYNSQKNSVKEWLITAEKR